VPRPKKISDDIRIGDVVDTHAPTGRWWKYGVVIDIYEVGPWGAKNTMVKVRHLNGEVQTYGIGQLTKTNYKEPPY
jgi:hypothetical protein